MAVIDDNFDIDFKQLGEVVEVAVRMMDNVVDVSQYPLPEQEKEAKDKRRIGLGVTGLADVLALSGIVYGSPKAVEWTHKVMAYIFNMAYYTSALLAAEKGAFPLYSAEYLRGNDFLNDGLNPVVLSTINHHGIRNALLTSIAPTGTISLYAGNVSSGIEPIFALEYDRRVMQKDGSHVTETVQDYGVLKWRRERPGEPLPDSFVTAQSLTPEAHINMQAAAQKWVDSSISKTVNVPEDISFDAFKDVYIMAWEMGCKGCTTYRPNDVTGSVLSIKEESADDAGSCELKYDENTGQLIRSCE
jgi:ribonucleoside-diphosphate reductase alpha chain